MAFYSNNQTDLAQVDTPQDSLLAIVEPDNSAVSLSHFVDWFTGNDLDSVWSRTNQTGGVTFRMVDEINQGFELLTDLIINTNGFISFNDIRQYSPTNTVFETIVRVLVLTDNFTFVGLIDSFPGNTDAMFFLNDSNFGVNIAFRTTQNPLNTDIDTGVVSDTNFHRYKGELTPTSGLGTIDGILRATSTTNLPLIKLQPFLRQGTRATANQTTGRIRYFEAFNK